MTKLSCCANNKENSTGGGHSELSSPSALTAIKKQIVCSGTNTDKHQRDTSQKWDNDIQE